MADTIEDGEVALTSDALFDGRLVLRQPAKGHRAGLDAVLLAAAVPRDFAGMVFDAGAGVGTAGLAVAVGCLAARVGLIENDPLSVALAAENVAANGLADRVFVHDCDLLAATSRKGLHLEGRADLVITNPPFHQPNMVRASPDPRRRAAHVSLSLEPEAWIKACLAMLGPHGMLIIIHQTEALPILLRALERRAGAITILPIHTKVDVPAKRILVRAVKGSRAPMAIAPPLFPRDLRNARIASFAW